MQNTFYLQCIKGFYKNYTTIKNTKKSKLKNNYYLELMKETFFIFKVFLQSISFQALIMTSPFISVTKIKLNIIDTHQSS